MNRTMQLPHRGPNDNSVSSKQNNERNSNLELLRIVAMLSIIAHHYVVNSTVLGLFDYNNPTVQQHFLHVWGMWGKTAINSFILISGYFMCRMDMAWQRYFKLLFRILFYAIVIMLIFGICGYEQLTPKLVFRSIFGLFIGINNGFTASFMAFYAFVPIYNKTITHLTQKEFILLICGLLFVFTFCSTFFNADTMNEPFWYMTLYFIAAYIRIYPNQIFNSLRFWSWILVIGVVVSVLSIFAIPEVARLLEMAQYSHDCFYFVSDSNKILAFVVGLAAFMFAKNLQPFHNKLINVVSAGTFGVLLIHASSDTMRRWLWQDICKVPQMLHAEMPILIIHALIIPLIIFALGSFIDFFYRKWIEKPLMKNLYVENGFTRAINKIFSNARVRDSRGVTKADT